ncbi:MAG TPA: HAMP domain-containing sensor histidine kinase [Actinomycetota bacterium]|nr:HAMP domain-containing sensor histidine kinase [Actinomycetota bacterium]
MPVFHALVRGRLSRDVWGVAALLCGLALAGSVVAVRLGVAREEGEALSRAATIADAAVAPALTGDDLSAPIQGDAARELGADLRDAILADRRIVRVRVWAPDGMLLFSTDGSDAVGRRIPPVDVRITDAVEGTPSGGVSTEDEDRPGLAPDPEPVYRAFVPLSVEGQRPDAAAEVDFRHADLGASASRPWRGVQLALGVGLIASLLLLLLSLRTSPAPAGQRPGPSEGRPRTAPASPSPPAEQQASAGEAAEDAAALRRKLTQAEARIGALEGEIALLTNQLRKVESERGTPVDGVAGVLREAEETVQEAAARAEEAEARAREAEARAERAEGRAEQAETRAGDAEARLEEARSRLQETEARLQETEARLQDAEARLQDADARARRAEEAEARAREAEARAEQAEARAEQAEARAERVEEAEEPREALVQATARAEQAEARAAEATALAAAAEARAQELEARLEHALAGAQAAEELATRLRDAEARLVDAERRLAEGAEEGRGPGPGFEERLAAAEARARRAEEALEELRRMAVMAPEAEEFRERLARAGATRHRHESQDTETLLRQAITQELRPALSQLLGVTLALKAAVGPDAQTFLRQLHAATRRLDRLVGDLQDAPRLADGTLPLRRRRTDLEALVQRVVGEMEALQDRVLEVDTRPAKASVDAGRIEQVVETVLEVVRERAAPGSAIWVEVGEAEGGARISVEDAGPVPPSLGPELTLAARIVELHGGRLWVEPRERGGTAFRLFLPERPPQEAPAPAANAPQAPSGSTA